MAKATKVWLITTKDVENLHNANGKEILFNINACEEYLIDKFSDKDVLTLIDFYSDYLNKDSDTVFRDGCSHIKSIKDISTNINKYNMQEDSSLLFDKVFQLTGFNVFLTRCFPDKLEAPEGFHIAESNKLPVYWLIAYANTVAKIINKPIDDIEFYGIFHSTDINSSMTNDMQTEIISIRDSSNNTLTLRIMRIKYSHDPDNYIYNDVILNTSFFTNIINDDIHNHILKSIEFPGIYERSEVIKKTNLSLDETVVKQYFLGCENNKIADAEQKFQSLFNQTKIELL